jgi:hypothetical protein
MGIAGREGNRVGLPSNGWVICGWVICGWVICGGNWSCWPRWAGWAYTVGMTYTQMGGLADEELYVVLREMAHLGFATLLPVHPHCPGYRILAVALRHHPTYAHFDPERVTLSLYRSGDQPEVVHWQRQTPLRRPLPACPGPVVITDRVNKRVQFFTFGGTLQLVADGHEPGTVYWVLTSPAPILPLHHDLMPGQDDQLAAECEAFLARLDARERVAGEDLMARLAELDPLQRYAGCIVAITDEYQQTLRLRQAFPDLYRLLKQERAWLETLPGAPWKPLLQLVNPSGSGMGEV